MEGRIIVRYGFVYIFLSKKEDNSSILQKVASIDEKGIKLRDGIVTTNPNITTSIIDRCIDKKLILFRYIFEGIFDESIDSNF